MELELNLGDIPARWVKFRAPPGAPGRGTPGI